MGIPLSLGTSFVFQNSKFIRKSQLIYYMDYISCKIVEVNTLVIQSSKNHKMKENISLYINNHEAHLSCRYVVHLYKIQRQNQEYDRYNYLFLRNSENVWIINLVVVADVIKSKLMLLHSVSYNFIEVKQITVSLRFCLYLSMAKQLVRYDLDNKRFSINSVCM